MTSWTKFEGRRSAADMAEPMVTIQKGGSLGFNKAAYNLLGRPERVVYLSDGSGKRFGIRTAETGEPDSYPVRAQQGERSFVAAAKLFLTWAHVPFGERPQKYPLHLEDGVCVVEIKAKDEVPKGKK